MRAKIARDARGVNKRGFSSNGNYRPPRRPFSRRLGNHVDDNSPESGSIRSRDIAIYILGDKSRGIGAATAESFASLWFGRAADYLWSIAVRVRTRFVHFFPLGGKFYCSIISLHSAICIPYFY